MTLIKVFIHHRVIDSQSFVARIASHFHALTEGARGEGQRLSYLGRPGLLLGAQHHPANGAPPVALFRRMRLQISSKGPATQLELLRSTFPLQEGDNQGAQNAPVHFADF